MIAEVKKAARAGEQTALDCIEIVRRLVERDPTMLKEISTRAMSLEDFAYIIVLHWKAFNRIATPDDTGKVLLTKERIEVLKYAASLCDSKNLSFKNAGYRAACDEIKICLLASVERLESGEQIEATATVCSDDTGKVLLTKEQHWLQELRPGGVGWIDYDELESREIGEQRLVELATTKPHRTFRYVLRTIIDEARADTKGTSV